MDEGRFSISAQALYHRLGTAAAPLVIDARRNAALDTDDQGADLKVIARVALWTKADSVAHFETISVTPHD
jgi:hypothetical protein